MKQKSDKVPTPSLQLLSTDTFQNNIVITSLLQNCPGTVPVLHTDSDIPTKKYKLKKRPALDALLSAGSKRIALPHDNTQPVTEDLMKAHSTCNCTWPDQLFYRKGQD